MSFVVYILTPQRKKDGYLKWFYVGSTNDTKRRKDQHNRLRSGGAKKTKDRHPYHMIAIVHGFTTHTDALEFEWHLDQLYRSKWLRRFFIKSGKPQNMWKKARHPTLKKRIMELERIVREKLYLEHWSTCKLSIEYPKPELVKELFEG
jgi:predicted GIY-YIG superfamily endonuclease